MGAAGDLTITDILGELRIDAELSGRGEFEAMQSTIRARNQIDHRAAVLAGALDRLGIAKDHGRTTRELLIVMGFAPSAAQRLLRIAAGAAQLPTLDAHAADGAISGEHTDAIVRGMKHIATRSPEPIDGAMRHKHVTDLLGQFFSGATPAEIMDLARTLGNQIAASSEGGLPAAEDRALNTLDHGKDDDGRLQVRADLDVEVGEKFRAAIDELAAPRPEPDGSPDAVDPASSGRRPGDAPRHRRPLWRHRVRAAHPGAAEVPADAPTLSSLALMGSVTEATMRALACDTSVTTVIVDGERVPLDISREKRFFPAHLRKALYVRDQCCIKCGAPADRAHAHHIRHWADGGDTCLVNGCLLCPSCHADVHHNAWEVFIGSDQHPWLIPPRTVDPRRRPLRAYNRRTLTTDDLALAG
ncbi:DUF222 domain-containing protein [Gordonia sp. DT218]|uniref:HNH endonuclease n=1 Tax=Gordonia sp. DT218 TaxID=3416659 RepID=UPI003CF692F2